MVLLVTLIVLGVFYLVYINTVGVHNPIENRREIEAKGVDGKVLSVKESVFQEIYAEALDVTCRQNEVNLKLAQGDISDELQNDIIRINYDTERVVEKSVNVGLLRKGKAKLTLV